MIFNFSQALNETVNLHGTPNWLIATGVAIVFAFIGVWFAQEEGDTESGPIIFKAGGAALIGFFIAAFASSGFNVAKSNFVANYGYKYYLQTETVSEIDFDLKSNGIVDLTDIQTGSIDNCVLPLEETGIKPSSIVLVKKGVLAALATVGGDSNTATELEYLERGGRSEFFKRTENLAKFDLSKYPDCNQLVDNPYLSDF